MMAFSLKIKIAMRGFEFCQKNLSNFGCLNDLKKLFKKKKDLQMDLMYWQGIYHITNDIAKKAKHSYHMGIDLPNYSLLLLL